MSFIEITRGAGPVVLGFPHTGTDVPSDIAAGLNETGRSLSDTDWHIHTLYAGFVPEVTTVRTTVHRYVIDVNRDPNGESLYPGQNTTTLCPTTDFDGCPIYESGQAPEESEITRRRLRYYAPYHAALNDELERVRAQHGFAILYDCHSIRSHIPFLFEGTLPDFNVGTNSGASCAPSIETAVTGICDRADGYSSVLNGRFKGGWTTRHYGRPDEGLHTVQMELAQSAYMVERPPWDYVTDRAERLRAHLKTILETLSDWRPE